MFLTRLFSAVNLESRSLHDEQIAYRQKLADISEERRLWLEQRDLVKATLAEKVAIAQRPYANRRQCPPRLPAVLCLETRAAAYAAGRLILRAST